MPYRVSSSRSTWASTLLWEPLATNAFTMAREKNRSRSRMKVSRPTQSETWTSQSHNDCGVSVRSALAQYESIRSEIDVLSPFVFRMSCR